MKPQFITFTGADDAVSIEGMKALAADYPIEWGILFSPKRQGRGPRYPSMPFIHRVAGAKLLLSAHLCGGDARDVLTYGASEHDELLRASFTRVQINTVELVDVDAIAAWAKRLGLQAILQCRSHFPAGASPVDWLFDPSGGRGVAPLAWAAMPADRVLRGFAGGLGPRNVAEAVASIGQGVGQGGRYWLDMETGVRTPSDQFDLGRCRAVCEALYGRKQQESAA